MPEYNQTANYYEKYWELYLQNETLMEKLSTDSLDRDALLQKMISIENFYEDNLEKLQSNERYLHNGRKKHNRRCANDIERGFLCPYDQCSKLYGSEGSLNLHIKIKHNGGNKTDREKIAKSLVYARASGMSVPSEIAKQVNLPPGSIETAAEQVGVQIDRDLLKSMEDDLRRQNLAKEQEMKAAELAKNKKFVKPPTLAEPPQQKDALPLQPSDAPQAPRAVMSVITSQIVNPS